MTAEPANTMTPGAATGTEQLPRPADHEPVLRVMVAPDLGEHAVVELWPGEDADPLRCVVPFRFTLNPRTKERLRWYVEEYAERPLDPAPTIAAEVEEQLEQLGETLFGALLGRPRGR